MGDLTSKSQAKDALATTPVPPIVVTSGGLQPQKKKKKLATLQVAGAYESTGTSEIGSKKWYFRLLLKIFRC